MALQSSLILALPRVPIAENVPRDLAPLPDLAQQSHVGWLLDGVASGRVPNPGALDDATAAQATFRLSIYQSDAPRERARCRRLPRPVDRHLVAGPSIGIEGASADRIRVVDLAANGRHVVVYSPGEGRTPTVVGDSEASLIRGP